VLADQIDAILDCGIPLLVLTIIWRNTSTPDNQLIDEYLLLFVNDFINGFWTPVTVL